MNSAISFLSRDTELLEEVEQPYLVSLSDSQVSTRDILSDCYSSDTLEVSNSSLNKAKTKVCYPKYECLFEEKHPSGDYGNNHTFKDSKDYFDAVFRMQGLKFKDRDPEIFSCNFLKNRITDSISSLNLNTYGIDCICEVSKIQSRLNGYGRNVLNQYKKCASLPNLDSIPNHEMICSLHKVLHNIPCIHKYSKDLIMRIVLYFANSCSFGDLLITNLLERVHFMQLANKDKDVLLSELMHSYDKLIIKHAEAENKIDKMRFDNSISDELSSVSRTGLKHNIQSEIDTTSITHQYRVSDILDTELYNEDEVLEEIHFTIPAVKAQRRIVTLELSKNEHDNKQIGFTSEEMDLDVKTSDKEITDSQVNEDYVFHNSDPDFHLCELDNKINLAKMKKDTFDEYSTYKNELSLLSDDESSLESTTNCDILRTENHLQSEKSLKNNFNSSYNRIITYAKAKRDLASYTDFHNLMFERGEYDSQESSPNIETHKKKEIFGKSIKENSMVLQSENEIIMVDEAQSLCIENVGLADNKLTCTVMENTSAVHPQALSGKDNCYMMKNNNFPEKSSGLLNNLLVQGKNSYDGADKVISKYFYSRIPHSNFEERVLDLKETIPTDNRIQMDIRNDVGGISNDDDSLQKELIYTMMDKCLEEKSESSHSLRSVKLEGCDCWNEQLSSHIFRGYEKENLSNESRTAISPLQLDLSSSDDHFLPIVGKNNQGCDVTLKSIDDVATEVHIGKMEGLSQLQMKPKLRRTSIRNASQKMDEGKKSIVLADYSQKKITQLMNSINKIDAVVSELKSRTEGLKNYLSLQLDSISSFNARGNSKSMEV